MYGSTPNRSAEIMDFRSYRLADHKAIRLIQESVEAGYVNGLPKHHLPSAFDVDVQPGSSCIFVCSYAQYVGLSTPTLQKIFRHRHILITNAPVSGIRFNINGLQTIGDVHEPRSIQSKREINFITFILISLARSILERWRRLEKDGAASHSCWVLR